MLISCLQGLGCHKSPYRSALAYRLRGQGAVECFQNTCSVQQSRREIADSNVGLSQKQKIFRAGSHSQVSCMATARRLWGPWTWGGPPPKSRSYPSLRWVIYMKAWLAAHLAGVSWCYERGAPFADGSSTTDRLSGVINDWVCLPLPPHCAESLWSLQPCEISSLVCLFHLWFLGEGQGWWW